MKQKKELPERNSRVFELIDFYSNGNVADFARKIDFDHQKLNRLRNIDCRSGKKDYPDVSTGVIEAIITHLPEVNLDWLIVGRGGRLKNSKDFGGIDQKGDFEGRYQEMLDKKDAKIDSLNREIGSLENELEASKKENVLLLESIAFAQGDGLAEAGL